MKSTTYIIIILAMVAIAGYFVLTDSGAGVDGASSVSGGSVQKIVIGMKNSNYYPNTIRVKVNNPVSISLDNSVGGCFRSFTIKEFGIAKYLKTPGDTIEFTPNKKGTFRFACSMGMGTGTLIVE